MAARRATSRFGSTPPLENGDRLSSGEFEKRSATSPRGRKAELVQGIAYLPDGSGRATHSERLADVLLWLGTYEVATPGVHLSASASVRLGDLDQPQPDALLRLDPALGGRCVVDPDDRLNGPPELVAEVATGGASYDLHQKFEAYRSHGVREYVACRLADRAIDWFRLEGDRYVPLPADRDGVSRSNTFPGLALDREAMLAGDMPRVLDVLRAALVSPIHGAFVRSLRPRRASRTARTRRAPRT